jgi:hypothetical protein
MPDTTSVFPVAGQKTFTARMRFASPSPTCWRKGEPPKLAPLLTTRWNERGPAFVSTTTSMRAPTALRFERTPSRSRPTQAFVLPGFS